MKKTILVVAAILFSTVFIGCKKNSAPAHKNIKVAISATSLTEGDGFLCTMAAGAAGGSADLKINGTVRSNESAISLTKADLVDGKVTIETTQPVLLLAMTIGGSSDQTPYTIKVEPTVGNDAKDATTFTVGTDVVARHFSFK